MSPRSALVALLWLPLAARPMEPRPVPPGLTASALEVRDFHPVEGPTSGPAVYYQVVDDPGGAFLRGDYRVGLESVTMGVEVPEALRAKAKRLRWHWRVRALPRGGNECRPGYGDSAASVFATFKRGLKWYILKFVWSPAAPRGAVCDRKRNITLARDTVVLESGQGSGDWVNEEVDLRLAFLTHFGQGKLDREVPDLVGVGVMTDGDQTSSPSGADWGAFQILY